MINVTTLVGRLTKDIELKMTPNNHVYCKFTLACDRRRKEDGTDFINCVVWGQSAEFLNNYARKGDIVGVNGHITTGSYEGQNGKVYTTEVTADSVRLIGNKKNDEPEQREEPKQKAPDIVEPKNYRREESLFKPISNVEIDGDELPFY